MSVSARYTALLDACVLYPAPLRDVLLSLANKGLYHARWTRDIQDEWVRNLLANRSDLTREKLMRTCDMMQRAVPDSMVAHYETIISGLTLPDPDDRHVLAGAIVGHADAIITFNLRDFPEEILVGYNIEPMHPDDFIANQLELRGIDALAAIKTLRARLRRPPVLAAQYVDTLERIGLSLTASHLREALELI